MLYDCRNGCIVPGISVSGETWETNENTSDSRPTMDVKTEEKQSKLGVRGHVTYSILGVDKTVSAKYLRDRKTTSNTARVTLEYKQMSSTNHFSPFEEYDSEAQKHALESGVATHLVTTIRYGCEVVFTFEKTVKEGQTKDDVQGPMVTYLKQAATDINLEKTNSSDESTNAFENCSIIIDGDFKFTNASEKPKTLEDAIRFCQGIHKIMAGRAYPKEVCLAPLSKFLFANTSISKLSDASFSLIDGEVKRVAQDLASIVAQAQNLSANRICLMFQGIRKQLLRFEKLVADYLLSFQQDVSEIIVEKRNDKSKLGKAMHSVYQKYSTSPFACTELRKWFTHIEKEITVLEKCLKFIGHQKVIKAFGVGEKAELIHSFEWEMVISLEFTLAGKFQENLIHIMECYQTTKPTTTPAPPNNWYLQQAMKTKMLQFMHLVRSTPSDQGVCFVVTDSTSREHLSGVPGIESGIIVFKYTNTIPAVYEIPSCPSKPKKTDSSLTSISIAWDAPNERAFEIKYYQISYWPRTKAHKSKTIRTTGTETNATIDTLKSNTDYVFIVCGVCCPGSTDDSEQSDAISTKGSPLTKSLLLSNPTSIPNVSHYTVSACTSKPTLNVPHQIAQYEVGTAQTDADSCLEKCIVVTGPSMLLIRSATDALFNFIMNVSYTDKVCFTVSSPSIEDNSEWITVCKIHRQNQITLTIVQVSCSPRLKERNFVQLETCLTKIGINQLHSLILVPEESCTSPLLFSSKCNLWSLLSFFGNDLNDSVLVLVPCSNEQLVLDREMQKRRLVEAEIPVTKVIPFYPFAQVAKTVSKGKEIWTTNQKMMEELLLHLENASPIGTKSTLQVLQMEQKLGKALSELLFEHKKASVSIKQEINNSFQFLGKNSLKSNPLYDLDILNRLMKEKVIGCEYLALRMEQVQIIQDIISFN